MGWYICIFIACLVAGVLIGKWTVKPIKLNNAELLQARKQIQDECDQLELQKNRIIEENKIEQRYIEQLQIQKQDLIDRLADTENDLKVKTLSAESIANASYQNKCIELDIQFEKDKQKCQNTLDQLKEEENALKEEIQNTQKELLSLKETRAAAIAAAQQEKNVSENKDFYCLILPPQELGDVNTLKGIVNKISKPRAVLMAIWSAYYQQLAKKKFPQILGKTDVCGIYKITNQETGECYIGQAVDVRKRWYEHAKMMLQIDAPQGNQLYAAAKEYGLDSFSFELLLECEPKELNEKEKYFIELYNSDAVGYNQNRGVKNN